MFQVTLTSYGQSQISSQVIIDGVILLYDYIENISSLSDISSYTVDLDEEACGNIKGSVGNIRVQDYSNSEYQSKTILFYKKDGNDKRILGGYSQETTIIKKTTTSLSLFISLDFSVFTNGFLFSSIQAGYPVATSNSDGLVHIENPDIVADNNYSVYSKSQVDSIINNSGFITENDIPLESISVDGTTQTITNKNVDLHIPHDLNSAELIGGFVRYDVHGSGSLTIKNTYGLFPTSTNKLPAGTYIIRVRVLSSTSDFTLTVSFGSTYVLTSTDGVIDDVRTVTLTSAKAFSSSISSVSTGTYIRVVVYEPNSIISSGSVGKAAISNDYNDLDNLPGGTLVIQQNGTDVSTFAVNAISNVTANITVPTTTSQLTNNSGYITSSSLPTVNNAKLTIKKNSSDSGIEFTANASTDVSCDLGLSTVATSGSYSDLSNTPTIPTTTSQLTNNSGFITSSDLPTNHVTVDTDQTITGAKTLSNNLLPSIDESYDLGSSSYKWSSIYSKDIESTSLKVGYQTGPYVTCTTEANTTRKDITITGFPAIVPPTGMRILIRFTYAHTGSTAPTLCINNDTTHVYNIRRYGSNNVSNSNYSRWLDNSIIELVFDGTAWYWVGFQYYAYTSNSSISSTYSTYLTKTVNSTSYTFSLNSSNNWSANTGIVASSFIKSSGTSSQFLKADGSVDSNTYVTTSTSQDLTGTKTFINSTPLVFSDSSGTAGSIYGGYHTSNGVDIPDLTFFLYDNSNRFVFLNNDDIELLTVDTSGVHASSFDGDLFGNASTATTLETSRTIDGMSFNGSSDIVHYGTCSSGMSVVAKIVDLPGFTLVKGSRVAVYFSYTNTATNPTLNVNSTGAKPICYRGSNPVSDTDSYFKWQEGSIVEFVYSGTNWIIVGFQSSVYYSHSAEQADSLSTGRYIDGVSFNGSTDIIHYGTCGTSASTQIKDVTIANFNYSSIPTGARVIIKFTYSNTSDNPQLRVNTSGTNGTAKYIKYSGSQAVSGSSDYYKWQSGNVLEFIYDGTYWIIVGWQEYAYYSYSSSLATQASADGDNNTITSTYIKSATIVTPSGTDKTSTGSSGSSTLSAANWPTYLRLTKGNSTTTDICLAQLMASYLIGFARSTTAGSLTPYGAVGSIGLFQYQRSSYTTVIPRGTLISTGTLKTCGFTSSGEEDRICFETPGTTISGTWVTLNEIPASNTSGYVYCLVLAIRIY